MDKYCKKCKIYKNTSDFHFKKDSKDGFYPYCKVCRGILDAEKYKDSSSKYKDASLKNYWRNPEKNNLKRRERYKRNPQREKQSMSKYAKNNPAKVNAIASKYRASKLKATPKWLTTEQLNEIEEFYSLAQELAWLNADGKPFHVDHIMPLQGKNFCGLHVPWNLQLLPAKENCKKRNKIL